MLFKEKLYLSNCDSVKQIPTDEVRKRVLLGLAFGEGIILSPNVLLDNTGILETIQQKNVVKYLNEEGVNSFLIRGFNIQAQSSISAYFDTLPDNYRVSMFHGKLKSNLSIHELKQLNLKLTYLDSYLKDISPQYEDAHIAKNSLTLEVHKRVHEVHDKLFSAENYLNFINNTQHFNSRSEWYNYLESHHKFNLTLFNSLKVEIIDPSYNSLFINSNEGFLQDKIPVLNKIPEKLLDSTILFKSLRTEIELIEYPIKLFQVIMTSGSSELIKLLTDEAIDYMEDKAEDKGLEFLSRKNWFGFYPTLVNKMGLEIKK